MERSVYVTTKFGSNSAYPLARTLPVPIRGRGRAATAVPATSCWPASVSVRCNRAVSPDCLSVRTGPAFNRQNEVPAGRPADASVERSGHCSPRRAAAERDACRAFYRRVSICETGTSPSTLRPVYRRY